MAWLTLSLALTLGAAQTPPVYLRCAQGDGVEIGLFGVFQDNLWQWRSEEGDWRALGARTDGGVDYRFSATPRSFRLDEFFGEVGSASRVIDRVTGTYTHTRTRTGQAPQVAQTGQCARTEEPRPPSTQF